jgi:hypothetical protein
MRFGLERLVINSWVLVSRGFDENFWVSCVCNVNKPVPHPAVNHS